MNAIQDQRGEEMRTVCSVVSERILSPGQITAVLETDLNSNSKRKC